MLLPFMFAQYIKSILIPLSLFFVLLVYIYNITIILFGQHLSDSFLWWVGYLDKLEKEYDDPVARYKEVARRITEEENAKKKLTLNIKMDEELEQDADDERKNGQKGCL